MATKENKEEKKTALYNFSLPPPLPLFLTSPADQLFCGNTVTVTRQIRNKTLPHIVILLFVIPSSRNNVEKHSWGQHWKG